MRRIAPALALVLVLAMAPPVVATHQNVAVPPHAVGAGANDVRDEPNHRDDANGFPHVNYRPSSEALVLDAYYVLNAQQVDVAVNELVNVVVHGSDVGSYEHVILPGRGHFKAWWGWWTDTGSGGHLQEQGVGGEPDGRIDDAHDDPATWSDPRQGPWDELVWRGENPWASQHGHEDYPGDRMVLLLQPGTFTPWNPLNEPAAGTGLADGADDPRVPDAAYRDNTGNGPYSPYPVEQRGGWVAAGGVGFTFTDASLLAAVQATTAVNPNPLGDGAVEPHEPAGDASDHAVDVDRYTAAHPRVADLYRTTVWDPGDREDTPLDALHEEGAKGFARWGYNGGAEGAASNLTGPVVENVSAAAEPPVDAAGPLAGAGEDAARPPYRHEPNHEDDDYAGYASHDPRTSYDGLEGPYYEPGPNQTYEGYVAEAGPWLDARAGAGSSVDALIFNLPQRGNARPLDGAAPGTLYVTAWWGTWLDEDVDTWVGTADDDPYQHGLVSDPNAYGSTEFRGLCHGTVQGTLAPVSSDGSWGSLGVYVVRDDGGAFNPYDDAALDALGDGPWGEDAESQMSRLVTHGPIGMSFTWCDPGGDAGLWRSDTTLVLPAGSLEVPVRVDVSGHADAIQEVRPTGTTLTDVTLRDVDVLPAGAP